METLSELTTWEPPKTVELIPDLQIATSMQGNEHSRNKKGILNIGVIGYGYWGPNIVRNFNSTEGARVVAICDKDPQVLKKVTKANPGVLAVTSVDDIVKSKDIDVVAIVTSVSSHYQLALKALENGKHIFVEKPFTTSVADAISLIEAAEKRNLKIMVDHTFLFTGAVRKIKELITSKILGNIFYYDSTRINLGLFQHDINVVWDLAPHDFAIMNYLISERPSYISAFGKSHVNHLEDVAYINLHFNSNIIAHFSVNWISPVKIRNVFIGGEKKMLVWDDINENEKIKVYDKGVEVDSKEGMYDVLLHYRTGDVLAPHITQTEALKLECEHFIGCIQNNTKPLSDGMAGLEVVKMLEACNKSIHNNGKMIRVDDV